MAVDVNRILEIGMQGLNLIEKLATSGQDIKKALDATRKVFSKDADQITDEELDQTEEELEDLLDDFERPLTRQS